MNSIIKEVKLGFSQETEVYTIYAKQNDSQRIINFELIDESNNYIIEDVTAIYFCETLSDGTVIEPIKIYPIEENNTNLESGSIVTLQFTSDMTKVPGLAHCELLFVQSDEPLIVENNQIIGEYETLTTQTFNLYIESSVSNGTKTHTKSSANDLIKLIIITQQLNDKCSAFEYGGTYTDSTGEHTITYENSREGQEGIRIGNESTRVNNESTRVTNEETRVSNETTRQANETIRVGNEATRVSNEEVRVGNETTRITAETERVRAEKERKAFESAGTYIDTEGESHTITYKDSRVGASKRERALLYGGTFTDIDGVQKSVSNQYEYGGQQYDANVSDLGGKSLMAIGASTHKAALDTKRWADATEDIYESLGGATLNLQFNVTASQILDSTDPNYIDVSIADIGDTYFVSEQFITDNNFAKGSGIAVVIGSAIYVNKNHKWDIISPSAFAQDMMGATSSTAGTHGLVPAPVAGDEEKVLSGAGTWIEVKNDPTYLCDSVEDTDVCTEIHTVNETIYVKSEDIIVQTMTALAIGDNIITSGENANAFIRDFKGEGYQSVTSGVASHAEGSQTTAAGFAAHAEGYYTSASGNYSHAEGICTSSTLSKVVASGDGSHAEGCRTTSSGFAAHAEGFKTSASKEYAHAEGYMTYALGTNSHAEGAYTTASEANCHAEGYSCLAWTTNAHAEGSNTQALNNSSHSEGLITISKGFGAHAEGANTSASSNYSHSEGFYTCASAESSHAEGNKTTSTGESSHAEGYQTIASGIYSHAEGGETTAYGSKSHAEGQSTYAIDSYSHAEGNQSSAVGVCSHTEGSQTEAFHYSHAEGLSTRADGLHSHAEGLLTTASSDSSHAEGEGTCAAAKNQHVSGKYNSPNADTTNRFIIGKGVSRNVLANSFRVNDSGVYGSGAYNSSGADYAEMFEWNDGNPNNEDRRGLFVTLKGDKIEKANSRTKFILGIVSGNPSVVGDVHDDQWNGMFEKDIFGTDIYEDVEVPDVTTTTINPETGEEETVVIIPTHVEHRQKLNPNYDSTQTYIPRSKRPEWNYVGMMGKLVVVDDGTCEIDGYCKSGNKGIATKSDTETKFRVMKRLDDTHIQVLVI